MLESDSEDEDYIPMDDEFEAEIKDKISKKEVMELLADACTEKRKWSYRLNHNILHICTVFDFGLKLDGF